MKWFSVIVFLILFIPLVDAIPGIPHQFYGYVNFTNGPAPNGLSVTAEIDGEEVASTTTLNGRYGYNPSIFFVTDPNEPGNDRKEGDIILFFVNGINTTETAIFENGAHERIDFLIQGFINEINATEPIEDQTIAVSPDSPLVVNYDGLSITVSSTEAKTATIEDLHKLYESFFTGIYAIKTDDTPLRSYEIRITGNVTITVTIYYGDKLDGLDEDSIVPYEFDGTEWVEITPFTRDETNKIITFTITGSTPYTITGFSLPVEEAPPTGGPSGGMGGGMPPLITQEKETTVKGEEEPEVRIDVEHLIIPSEIIANESFDLGVVVKNNGNKEGTDYVLLTLIDGWESDKERTTVTLAPGKLATVHFTIMPSENKGEIVVATSTDFEASGVLTPKIVKPAPTLQEITGKAVGTTGRFLKTIDIRIAGAIGAMIIIGIIAWKWSAITGFVKKTEKL